MNASPLSLNHAHPFIVARLVNPEEKFTPPELEDAKLIACYTGGNGEGTNDVTVIVQYMHRNEYRAMIAQRPDVNTALADCQAWFGDVRKEFQKLIKH